MTIHTAHAPGSPKAMPALLRSSWLSWTIAFALLAIALAVGTLGFFALKASPAAAGGAPVPAEAQPAPGP